MKGRKYDNWWSIIAISSDLSRAADAPVLATASTVAPPPPTRPGTYDRRSTPAASPAGWEDDRRGGLGRTPAPREEPSTPLDRPSYSENDGSKKRGASKVFFKGNKKISDNKKYEHKEEEQKKDYRDITDSLMDEDTIEGKLAREAEEEYMDEMEMDRAWYVFFLLFFRAFGKSHGNARERRIEYPALTPTAWSCFSPSVRFPVRVKLWFFAFRFVVGVTHGNEILVMRGSIFLSIFYFLFMDRAVVRFFYYFSRFWQKSWWPSAMGL